MYNKPFYGCHMENGDLFVFGKNIIICHNNLDALKSVEEICIYCNNHHLRINYRMVHKSIQSFIDYIHILRLCLKYNVYASNNTIKNYISEYFQ